MVMNYFSVKNFMSVLLLRRRRIAITAKSQLRISKVKYLYLDSYATTYPIWVSNVKISDMIVTIVVML